MFEKLKGNKSNEILLIRIIILERNFFYTL